MKLNNGENEQIVLSIYLVYLVLTLSLQNSLKLKSSTDRA